MNYYRCAGFDNSFGRQEFHSILFDLDLPKPRFQKMMPG